jgi:hypothetical protein
MGADGGQDDAKSLALEHWRLSGQLGGPCAVIHRDFEVVAESLDRGFLLPPAPLRALGRERGRAS